MKKNCFSISKSKNINKIINLILLLVVMLSFKTFYACKKKIIECESSLLDLSGNNYTIEINDNSAYTGTYYITNNVIKKTTKNKSYYYFNGDDYKYYRSVNGFLRSKDNNEIYTTLNIIKDIFVAPKYLYTNEDNTIFKTKSGNKVYNISNTEIKMENLPISTDYIQVEDLKNSQNSYITPSAIKIEKTDSLVYYIKSTTGIQKFVYNQNNWIKTESEIKNLDELKESILLNSGENYYNEDGMYLSPNGNYIKEFKGSLCSTFPSIKDNNYTLKDFQTNTIYRVTQNRIKIENENDFDFYSSENNIIYKYTNKNIKGYITKEVTSYNSINSIVEDIVKNFSFSYPDIKNISYIIIGDNQNIENYYSLSLIKSTSLTQIKETAQKTESINLNPATENFTFVDKIRNITYTFTSDILEIIYSDRKEYFSKENQIVYHYQYKDGKYEKVETSLYMVKDAVDYEKFLNNAKNDNLLKILNSDVDFESQNYLIKNVGKNILIELPKL